MPFNPNGIFYTSFNPDQLNTDSFASMVMREWPNGSFPLYGLTSQLPKSKANGHAHGYFTKRYTFPSLVINNAGGYAVGDTTFTVQSTEGIVEGMVFQTAARENIRVESVPNATSVVVQRNYGRMPAAAIADAENLFIVGNSHSQASNRPVARSIQTQWVPNYTVIIRNAWALSNSARESLAEADYNNIAENRADCAKLHALDHEGQILWGQARAPAGTPTVSATQGIVDAIYEHAPNNVFTAGATTNKRQLETMCSAGMQYSTDLGSGNERLMVMGSTAMQVFQDIGFTYGNLQVERKETVFGMVFTEMVLQRGRVRALEHPYLNETGHDQMAIMLDLNSMALAYLGSRDAITQEFDGTGKAAGEGTGIDATIGSLLSEFATEFKSPSSCVIINGLTQAA